MYQTGFLVTFLNSNICILLWCDCIALAFGGITSHRRGIVGQTIPLFYFIWYLVSLVIFLNSAIYFVICYDVTVLPSPSGGSPTSVGGLPAAVGGSQAIVRRLPGWGSSMSGGGWFGRRQRNNLSERMEGNKTLEANQKSISYVNRAEGNIVTS